MSHRFGDLLSQFLHRKHGLSQFKLAEGILQSPSVISEMCKGKRLSGPQARERVVAIITWLHEQDALYTPEEANALLEAAGMSPLREGETSEAWLLEKLGQTPLQPSSQPKENILAETSHPHLNGKRSAIAAPHHNLPAQMTSLIGREGEVETIIQMLDNPDCRLLTLVGQGGVGKTRLAVQSAAQVAHNFPDGVFFVELHPVMEPAHLAQAILDALRTPIYGADDPRKLLVNFLREQKTLLVVDNFDQLLHSTVEHISPTLSLLAEIISEAPQVKLMVTSREVLNLSGEWIYQVLGLSYPLSPPDETTVIIPRIDDLSRFPAIQLFDERARRVKHNFSALDEMAGIVQVCQLVDGLPLALEMAAAWTKLMSCTDIAVEIKRNLAFLGTRYQDVPVRHRNILAVIDQSWQALSPEERHVFARLSVFEGGFQRQAAEQVAGATLSILSALVDKSLLRWDSGDRYHFHELLRQFSKEQLQADAEATRMTYHLHCMYYADFLERCNAAITGPHQLDVLRSIMAELQNIRAAWQHAVEEGNLTAIRKATYSFYMFCDFTSRYVEIDEALPLAIARIMEVKEIGLQEADALALLQTYLGFNYIRLGRYESAKKALIAGQEIIQKYPINIYPGFATDPLTGLSLLALINCDYAASIKYAEQSRDASLLRNDLLNLQLAYYLLASAFYSAGEYNFALANVVRGLNYTEVTGNRWMQALILTTQGQIAQAQNEYNLAQQKFQESCQIKQELNDPGGAATAINHLATIALLQGNLDEANRLYRESLEIFLHVNDPGGLGSAYAGLGDTALAGADLPLASHYYEQGLEIATRIQWLPLTIALLTGISDWLRLSGRPVESATLLNQILACPTITEDARVRARQSLERTLLQLPFQILSVVPAEQTEESLNNITKTLLAELAELD